METFVVRVFVPAEAGEARLAGLVEQVGTGWSARFASGEELLAAIRPWVERESGSPERVQLAHGQSRGAGEGLRARNDHASDFE
jgi:hypothetical protein